MIFKRTKLVLVIGQQLVNNFQLDVLSVRMSIKNLH